MSDGIYFVDKDRMITYWNRGAEAITGYSRAEVIGRFCRDNLLVHTDANGCGLCGRLCPLLETFHSQANYEADIFLKHKQGHRVPVWVRAAPLRDESGEVVGGIEVFSHAASKLAALERAAQMERLALLDPLTGVGNRRHIEETLRENCESFSRLGEPFSVLFVDLDHFKQVNDMYGHDVGDDVLRGVATTIVNNLRSYDYFGRWGGEEFVAVLPNCNGDLAHATAERCRGLVRSCGIRSHGQEVKPTVSIGVAVVRPGDCPEHLMKRVDINVYTAKRGGRDRVVGP